MNDLNKFSRLIDDLPFYSYDDFSKLAINQSNLVFLSKQCSMKINDSSIREMYDYVLDNLSLVESELLLDLYFKTTYYPYSPEEFLDLSFHEKTKLIDFLPIEYLKTRNLHLLICIVAKYHNFNLRF